MQFNREHSCNGKKKTTHITPSVFMDGYMYTREIADLRDEILYLKIQTVMNKQRSGYLVEEC